MYYLCGLPAGVDGLPGRYHRGVPQQLVPFLTRNFLGGGFKQRGVGGGLGPAIGALSHPQLFGGRV